jgi:hypothetical protein
VVEVKGSFRVNKLKWATMNTQYAILFLKERMVFVKVGGQFADTGIGAVIGGVAGGGIGAGLGQVIEEKVRGSSFKKRENKIKSFEKMSIDKLLKMDKKNFEIPYKDISKIGIKKTLIGGLNGPRTGVLLIEGKKKEKFDICLNQKYEECEKIVKEVLSDKLK